MQPINYHLANTNVERRASFPVISVKLVGISRNVSGGLKIYWSRFLSKLGPTCVEFQRVLKE